MSLAIPILLLLLFGIFVYRVLAPARPRARAVGTDTTTAPFWSDGGASTAGWAGEGSTSCSSDSGGSDGGSCGGDSGGGGGGD